MLRDEEGVAVPRMGHDLPPYQAARNPSDEPNAQVVQFIAEQEVHKSVEKVYGSSLIRQLQLARAEFLRLAVGFRRIQASARSSFVRSRAMDLPCANDGRI